jgi:hypothetical protein
MQVPIPGIKNPVVFNDTTEPIANYINGVYNYAVGIVGILAAIMLMVGGFRWILAGGNASSIGEAKEIIFASLSGLVLVMTSWLILSQINPALTSLEITKIQPVTFKEGANMFACEWIKKEVVASSNVGGNLYGGTPTTLTSYKTCQEMKGKYWENAADSKCGGLDTDDENVCCCEKPKRCQAVSSGSCARKNLAIFGDKADEASAICQGESGNDPDIDSKSDVCADGSKASWGLFQINITAHYLKTSDGQTLNCPEAFSGGAYTAKNHSCRVIKPSLYNSCVEAAKDPKVNIQKAYELYSAGGWSQWGFYNTYCKTSF